MGKPSNSVLLYPDILQYREPHFQRILATCRGFHLKSISFQSLFTNEGDQRLILHEKYVFLSTLIMYLCSVGMTYCRSCVA